MKNRILLIALVLFTSGGLLGPGMLAGQEQESGEYPEQPQTQAQAQPQYPNQPQNPTQPQSQPPSAVGRLSVVKGEVSTMHGDNGQWVAGTLNTPVQAGDKVATADGARAEIQLDDFNVMRLDQRTEAQVAGLEPTKIQIQLASGLVDYSALNGTQADVEIDTPNMGVHPLAPGVYRVLVNSATDTQVIVRRGEVEILTNQGSTKVQAGQMIQIRGSDNPEYKVDSAPGADDFDKWCMDRDHRMEHSEARQRTGPDYTGSSDMDGYGQWNEVPDYGWCWTPQVDAGWVPYSVGNWGWEPYWGWTWISGEPWGWAPYHYGRWFMYGGSWRWWPAAGFYGPHPIWAPAYVSFFGFGGGGFGLGFGFGSIGWLALGPRDIIHPWWGSGRGFGAVGFGHLGPGWVRPGGRPYGSNLERVMGDARMRNAVMHVSAQDFAAGRMTRMGPVNEGMLRNSSMVRGGLGVTPTRAAMGTRVGNFSNYRLAPSNQRFFSSRSSGFNRGSTARLGGNTAGFGARSNGANGTRMEGGARGTFNSGQGYQRGNSGRSSTGGQGRSAAPQGTQRSWDRYVSPNPYAGGRQGYQSSRPSAGGQGRGAASSGTQRSWDRYASPSPYGGGRQNYQGGSRGWNSPAPRSGGSYYGGGSRPAMQLNRPVMRQRAPSGGYYGGGRGGYSAPRGGGYSAPRSNGGGGGGGYHGGGGGGGSHGGGGGGHGGGGGRR